MTPGILPSVLRLFLSAPQADSFALKPPREILVVRQHNQLGDLLAAHSMLRGLKETYPGCRITFIAGPQNQAALRYCPFVDELFVFNKKALRKPAYFASITRLLKRNFDLIIAPAVVSISFTSNLLARLASGRTRIGVERLEDKQNEYSFFFNHRVALDWREAPGTHIWARSLDILKPFGVKASTLQPAIAFGDAEKNTVDRFFTESGFDRSRPVVGIHAGAGKPPNRWSWRKFVEVVEYLKKERRANVYLTASSADAAVTKSVQGMTLNTLPVFLNRTIAEVAAVIEASNLYITNDTGALHIASATPTPQISLFGPTEPEIWAPVGPGKRYIRKESNVGMIALEDVVREIDGLLPHGA